MLDIERVKVINEGFRKTKFQKIHPFTECLESLLEHVTSLEESNERLREELNNYSKDEEILKYKREAENARRHSLYMLDEEEKKRIEEFSQEHYEKCGRAGYIRYIVTPTGIGTAVEVECNHCKERKDISNFNNW